MLLGPKLVIPNGFDFTTLPDFNKSRHVPTSFPFDSKLLLICPARFSPEKGHHLLFQALERVKFDYHITLVGTGCNHKNPKLATLISKCRDKVSLIEHSSSIFQLYRRHHYTILLSSSESFPNVVVESMALSVPIICSDVGDSKSIVGSFGFVLKDRTVTEAYESLCSAYRLCTSPAYSDMCSNARNYVADKYSVTKMTQSFISLL
jgi:glycosyltransferase involved in cell wall biosynthesis